MLGSMNLDMGAETNPVAVTSSNLASNEKNFHTYAAFKYFFLKNEKYVLNGCGAVGPAHARSACPHSKKTFSFFRKNYLNAAYVWKLFSFEVRFGDVTATRFVSATTAKFIDPSISPIMFFLINQHQVMKKYFAYEKWDGVCTCFSKTKKIFQAAYLYLSGAKNCSK